MHYGAKYLLLNKKYVHDMSIDHYIYRNKIWLEHARLCDLTFKYRSIDYI